MVLTERGIPTQRHPIVFQDFSGLLGAAESRGGRKMGSMRIHPFEIKCEAGLWTGQFQPIGRGTSHWNSFEIGRLARGTGPHQRSVSVPLHFTEVIVRQAFAETTELVWVAIFVPIVLVLGKR